MPSWNLETMSVVQRQIKQDGAYLKVEGRFHKENKILKLFLKV